MGIVRWNPSMVNRVFDDFFNASLPTTTTQRRLTGTTPAVNVRETEDDYQLEVAAPGLEKNDFKVEVEDGLLTISAEKKVDNKEETEKNAYTRREFRYQSFTRRFTLPETANDQAIEAKYEAGILRVVLPKKEEAKPQPARMIEIG